MNRINPNNTHNIHKNERASKMGENQNNNEINTEKMVKNLLVRAEREVPEYGDFSPVYEEIKNSDKNLSSTDFLLKITAPPKNIEEDRTVRNLELSVYKIPHPYKAERIIAVGTKQDILKTLENPEIVAGLQDAYKSLSRDLDEV